MTFPGCSCHLYSHDHNFTGLFRNLHSGGHCQSLTSAGTYINMPPPCLSSKGSCTPPVLWAMPTPALTCPLPPAHCRNLHPHDHCSPGSYMHQQSHAHCSTLLPAGTWTHLLTALLWTQMSTAVTCARPVSGLCRHLFTQPTSHWGHLQAPALMPTALFIL